jgi:hypothetical protein
MSVLLGTSEGTGAHPISAITRAGNKAAEADKLVAPKPA